MVAGVKHYFRDGKPFTGKTHKDASGRAMSGARHSSTSKYLFHMNELSATAKKRAKK